MLESTVARPAVFLDRDGTLNVAPPSGEYVCSPGELELLPGAVEAVGQLKAAGLAVVVVTNQSCIAKGALDEAGLSEIHRKLGDLLAESGGAPDLVLHCPHVDADGCDCRKPKAGMWHRAARELGIDLARSYTVGDSARDLEAGRSAGTNVVFVWGNAYPGEPERARALGPDMEARSLAGAAGMILSDARTRGIIG